MNAFEIIIYAVAALALILVFLTLILPMLSPGDNLPAIKTALENAKLSTNLGKTISLGALPYAKGATILASSFDKKTMLLGIECTSPTDCCPIKTKAATNCDKAINWDSTFFTTSREKNIYTYVRCIQVNSLPACKIFFGGNPAQAAIEKATPNGANAAGEEQITLTIKNTGSLPLTNATTTVELYKKGPEGWVITDYPSAPKATEILQSGEKTTINWVIAPQNVGEYRALFTFASLDGGFDKKPADFNKIQNTICTATTTGDTIFDPDTGAYKEMRECAGCSYAYECAGTWQAKEPSKTFQPESNTEAYCTKTTQGGNC